MTDRIEAIEAWAVDAAFRNEDGSVRTWYHGTNADPFNVFTLCDEGSVGFHFGDAAVASARAEDLFGADEEHEGASVIPVLCRAVNPLRLDDLHCWDPDDCISALVAAGVMTPEEADAIEEDGGLFELPTMYAYLEEAGHDAVVYPNLTESRIGKGGTASDSMFVWRAELLKSPFSETFERDDPRLASQVPASEGDMVAWRHMGADIERERSEIRDRRMHVALPVGRPAFA